jgi:hypothetical protein
MKVNKNLDNGFYTVLNLEEIKQWVLYSIKLGGN